MVNFGLVIAIIGVVGFLLAGGGKLVSPAISSVKQTVAEIKGGIDERTQNVQKKSSGEMGQVG